MLTVYLSLIEDQEDSVLLTHIYNTYKKQMLCAANDILNNSHSAEDAVHNAFLSVSNHMSTLKKLSESKVRTYMLTCAKHEAINIIRKNNKYPVLPIDSFCNISDENATEQMNSVFGKGAVMEILDILNPKYRDSLFLYYVEGLKEQEISDILHIKINTVRQHIHRGKIQFKKYYEEEMQIKDESKL